MSEFSHWMRGAGIITMMLATALVMWAIIIVTIVIAVGTF